jgi:hypothetical protein
VIRSWFTRHRLIWGTLVLVLLLAGVALLWRWKQPAHSQPPAQPLEFREKLVKRLAPESVAETINNLPDFQDVGWVSGSFPNGPGGDGTYQNACNLTPRLNRVRKLLEQGRKHPDVVIPLLEQHLDAAAQGLRQAEIAINEESFRTGDWGRSKPAEYDRKLTISMSAVYLLAELKSYRSLPLMARIYERKEERLPVSRVFLWYAMHTLALDHPREGLSPEALKVLDAYLEATLKDVPPPRLVSVSAWNAALEESDVRVVVGKQDIGLDQQPKIQLHEYPGSLRKDEFFIAKPSARVERWFQQLKGFVVLAYPDGR